MKDANAVTDPIQARGETRSIDFIVRMTSLALLVSLAIAHDLYAGHTRIFLSTPLIGGMPDPAWLQYALYAVAMGCLGWRFLKPEPGWTTCPVLAAMLVWSLQDVQRVQAYTCLYAFVLLVITVWRHQALPALRITMAGFYFWAGFQKLNLTFMTVTFPWFVESLSGTDPHGWIGLAVLVAGAVTPFFELAVATFLLMPRLRRTGLHMAALVGVFAMVCLGPFGRDLNVIVWPLNIYVVLLDFALFYRFDEPGVGYGWQRMAACRVSIVAIVLSPLIATLGILPSFPAFKLYSGNIARAHVIFSDAETLENLPIGLGKLVRPDRHLTLLDWTLAEFETTPFPDPAVFRNGGKGLCPYLSDPSHAILRIYEVPKPWRSESDFTDAPLCDEAGGWCLPGDKS